MQMLELYPQCSTYTCGVQFCTRQFFFSMPKRFLDDYWYWQVCKDYGWPFLRKCTGCSAWWGPNDGVTTCLKKSYRNSRSACSLPARIIAVE